MIDMLLTAIDLIDGRVREYIRMKKELFEVLAESISGEIGSLISKELGMESYVKVEQDFEDPMWIRVVVLVHCSELDSIEDTVDRVGKEMDVYYRVISMLDRLYSERLLRVVYVRVCDTKWFTFRKCGEVVE